MVTPIDQRDAHIGVAEGPGGGEATEAAADDDNVGRHGSGLSTFGSGPVRSMFVTGREARA